MTGKIAPCRAATRASLRERRRCRSRPQRGGAEDRQGRRSSRNLLQRLPDITWKIGEPRIAAQLQGANVRDDRALRSEEHTSELQSLTNLVCRLLLEKKKHDL